MADYSTLATTDYGTLSESAYLALGQGVADSQGGLWDIVSWDACWWSGVAVVVPTKPGMEWTLKKNRLHWTMKDRTTQWTMPKSRMHWTLPEDDQ